MRDDRTEASPLCGETRDPQGEGSLNRNVTKPGQNEDSKSLEEKEGDGNCAGMEMLISLIVVSFHMYISSHHIVHLAAAAKSLSRVRLCATP